MTSRGFVVLALLLAYATPHLGALEGAYTKYREALGLRDDNDSTPKDQKIAHGLFLEASGLVSAYQAGSANVTKVPGYPHLVVLEGGDLAALREVASDLMSGTGTEPDQQLATELFRLAAAAGDPVAQGQMGVRLAVGLADAGSAHRSSIRHFGQPDEATAVLHYTFGAAGGDTFSHMALGYRHYYGLGVPQSCWTAASYYQPVAAAVLDDALASGGLPHIERLRLNLHATQGLRTERHKEVLQWYQYSADQGNVAAQAMVGQVLNAGTHGVSRDHSAAAHYLQRAGGAGDAEAMANLGSMYAAGMGVGQDFAQALAWFQKAVERHDKLGLYSLGYMYLTGKGVPQRYDRAYKYFSNAAEGGDRDSHFFLGVMHLQGLGVARKSPSKAFLHFVKAAQQGHSQAMYNAAMMQLAGQGTQRSCKPAVVYLKLLAEKGFVAAELQHAHEYFFKGSYAQALMFYLRAAEMGLEFGQSNAAWMLDRGYAHAGPHALALSAQLYRRSAEQGNVVSLLQLGDRYYYGNGVDQDWVRAAAIYYEAYQERSAEAMFDLGFMHQYGAGVPQDLTLALRFYDMCKHTMADAALPVALAKAWLRLHEAWLWLLPKLPSGLHRYAKQLFVLRPSRTGAAGAAGGLLPNLMPSSLSLHWESMAWRLAKFSKLVIMQLPWELLNGEFGDTILLVVLLVVLWVVLRVRRQRQITAGQGGQPGLGAAVGPMGLGLGQPALQQQQQQPWDGLAGLQRPQQQQQQQEAVAAASGSGGTAGSRQAAAAVAEQLPNGASPGAGGTGASTSGGQGREIAAAAVPASSAAAGNEPREPNAAAEQSPEEVESERQQDQQ